MKKIFFVLFFTVTISPVFSENSGKNKDSSNKKSSTIFGDLPEVSESGVGFYVLYRLDQFRANTDQVPHMAGLRGYGQYGRFLRFGGFFGFGQAYPYSSFGALSFYFGPLMQFTIPVGPVKFAIGSVFGLGMDFYRSKLDYLIFPHAEIEFRLFDHLSFSVIFGYFKSHYQEKMPEDAKFNLSFTINFINEGGGLKPLDPIQPKTTNK